MASRTPAKNTMSIRMAQIQAVAVIAKTYDYKLKKRQKTPTKFVA